MPSRNSPKIIVPYTKLPDILVNVLTKLYRFDPRFVKMDHDGSYFELISNLWAERETFVMIEHDILPWPGAIEELLMCPMMWCSNSYNMISGHGIHHSFGCTKFSQEFIDRLPDVWSGLETCMWNTLDAQLYEVALHSGLLPHPHRPPVIHLKGFV